MRGFGDARARVGVELALLLIVLLLGGLLAVRLLGPAPAPDAAVRTDPAIFAAFDPFFRRVDGGAGAITEADLRLFGVRQDQATGRGAAIIGLPDGTQASIAVGEEVSPGIVLHAVGPDNVTLLREGRRELLFLDETGGQR